MYHSVKTGVFGKSRSNHKKNINMKAMDQWLTAEEQAR
jgi:hypothetical protein